MAGNKPTVWTENQVMHASRNLTLVQVQWATLIYKLSLPILTLYSSQHPKEVRTTFCSTLYIVTITCIFYRAAVGMGIPMGMGMGMGMGWVWGLWWIPMGLWGFHGDFRMDSKLRGNELNAAHFFWNLFYWNSMLTVVVLMVVQCYLISARWYVNLCFDITVQIHLQIKWA